MRPPPFILVQKSNAPNRGETGPNGAAFRPGEVLARPTSETGTQGPHGADGALTAGPSRGLGGAAVPLPDTGPGNPPAPCRPAPGNRRPSSPAARPAPVQARKKAVISCPVACLFVSLLHEGRMRLGQATKKAGLSLVSALAFHYLCCTKIGCGSAKP